MAGSDPIPSSPAEGLSLARSGRLGGAKKPRGAPGTGPFGPEVSPAVQVQPEGGQPVYPGDVDLIDGSSWHEASLEVARLTGRDLIKTDFAKVKEILAEIRASHGRRRSSKSIIALTFDSGREAQARFREALLRQGHLVWDVDFRDVGTSPSPGSADAADRMGQILSPRIAFALGAQLRYGERCDVLVVSHDFALLNVMTEFLGMSPDSTVLVAYFKCFLERRWHWKLEQWRREGRSNIRFVNLEPYSERMFGIRWPDSALADRSASPAEGSPI